RYVRLPDRDDVYQVKIDADKFSTKFKDWIEPKLLKLDSFKIKNVTIIDTGLKEVAPGEAAPETRGVMEFTYDEAGSGDHWKLLDAPTGTKLDETKLNDLKSALDDMKIVDVHPKGQALSKILSGKGQKITRAEMMQINMSLQTHGFY